MNEAYIIDAIRIPRARAHCKDAAYASLKPVDLLKPLFKAIENRNGINSADIDDVILGCVTQTGDQGANIAKIASLYAGWSSKVSGATVNRFCCSGLDAINFASSNIMAGMDSLIVAGGIEKLSSVPMFSDAGAWFSDPNVMEASKFMHMGLAADLIAAQQGYTREQLDVVAMQSHQRAEIAQKGGYFQHSLIPVNNADGSELLSVDEGPRSNLNLEKLSALPASFSDFVASGQRTVDSVYTNTILQALHSPGNSPALVDGASLVLLANADKCKNLGLKPRAKIRHFSSGSDEPVKMLTGHISATKKLLRATRLSVADIDLWEVNESFAASVLNYQHHFQISDDNLNVNGGAIALGHPLGATGGNLVGSLLDELERKNLHRGIVSICGGAGVGVATMIERIN